MHCPFCREQDTKVVDSRLVNDGDAVRRRRACSSCGERFNTFEYPELSMPKLIKRDGSREVFHEKKLRAGFVKALEKRPVGEEKIETSLRFQQVIFLECYNVVDRANLPDGLQVSQVQILKMVKILWLQLIKDQNKSLSQL